MRAPVGAQQLQGGHRQGDLALLAALAAHAQDAPRAIDIGDLETRAFHQAQTAAVDRGQADPVDLDPDLIHNVPYFPTA